MPREPRATPRTMASDHQMPSHNLAHFRRAELCHSVFPHFPLPRRTGAGCTCEEERASESRGSHKSPAQQASGCLRARDRQGNIGRGGRGWGAGGVWVPKVCVPKIAQQDFPNCKFRFFPRWLLWWGGGGGWCSGFHVSTVGGANWPLATLTPFSSAVHSGLRGGGGSRGGSAPSYYGAQPF